MRYEKMWNDLKSKFLERNDLERLSEMSKLKLRSPIANIMSLGVKRK